MVTSKAARVTETGYAAAQPRVSEGYKLTEVGVIPEDWGIEFIENLAHITTGSRNTQDRVDDGQYPFFVRSQTVERINSYSFDGESVLTAGDGVGTGRVFHYIKGKFDAHQRVYRISHFSEEINGYFFYLYFSSHFYGRIMQMTAKSSVDSVRREMITKMLVPVPPTKAEQEAIAGALSNANALIDSLEQLVTKKRQIKQGAMQELLAGKKRLLGFERARGYKHTEAGVIPEDWQIKSIGQIAPLQRGFDLPKFQLREGPYPVVYSNGVMNYHDTAMVRGPGVVTGRSGTLGAVHYVDTDYWPHNTSLWVTHFNGNSPRYVFYLYAAIGFERFASGSGVPTLNRNDAHAFRVALPPTNAEQEAIAAILADMDTDLSALEAKLAKARMMKQGMMQELLTGKTRLI
jgi:type I restriction enzyme S subunit